MCSYVLVHIALVIMFIKHNKIDRRRLALVQHSYLLEHSQ